MNLNRTQKKYIKKNLKKLSLEEIANNLEISPKDILIFLKSSWRPEKYQKFLKKIKSETSAKVEINPKQIKSPILNGQWLKENWKNLILLALLVIGVYFNALNNEFLSDDIAAIVQNKDIGNFQTVLNQPINYLRPFFYLIAYKIGGLKPIFFRLINIFFHMGTVLLIYILISSLINDKTQSFFAAGVFAVHPILIESVTWISGGVHAQYAFFLLLSFFFYIRFTSSHQITSFLFSFLAALIAIISSEKAIVIPAIFLLYLLSFDLLKEKWKTSIPFWILSLFFGLFHLKNLGMRISVLQNEFYSQPQLINPLFQIPIATTSYLELIFWPKNLTLYHSEMNFTPVQFLLRAGIFIGILALIIFFFKKNRWLFFWSLFFFISLSPTLNPFGVSWLVAERYAYLSSIGIFVIFTYGLQKLGHLFHTQKISFIIFLIIIILLGIRSFYRNIDWKNQDNLWLAAAKTSPSSPQNHNNLGDLYYRHGNLEKAAEEFKRAIELKPNYGDAYHNLANVYTKMGKFKEAEENYKTALILNPNLWQSHLNLANIYFNQKKYELAKEELEKSIKINEQNSELFTFLAVVYYNLKEKDKAREALQQAIKIDPENQKAKQYLLGLNEN